MNTTVKLGHQCGVETDMADLRRSPDKVEHHKTRARHLLRVLAALCFIPALNAVAAADSAVVSHTLSFDGTERTYHTFEPTTAGDHPAPLLVLLHGSYQTALQILSAWQPLAEAQGVVLVAPAATDIRWWQIRKDGPAFIHSIVAAAAAVHDIDPDRVYLFGISGGAVHALTIAMLESREFAAVAVFAGAWRDERSYAAIDAAERPIPVAIFIGSRDEYFPLSSVRHTESALERAGHPVAVTVLPRRRHDYSKVVDEVNAGAWAFLRTWRLTDSAPATARGTR